MYAATFRGGFILYRTQVPPAALSGESGVQLDIGAPVHDYAMVSVGFIGIISPNSLGCLEPTWRAEKHLKTALKLLILMKWLLCRSI